MNAEADPLPGPASKAQRLLTAAALYFCMVFFVGALLGPLRALWLEPWAGPTIAVLCEAPLLIVAMNFAAKWAPVWARFEGGWLSLLAMGTLALVLQQMADLAVGFGLRGMTFNSQVDYFATPPGWIYAFCLIVFALMPIIARARRKSRARPPVAVPPADGSPA